MEWQGKEHVSFLGTTVKPRKFKLKIFLNTC